jgi:hypothetical protein
MICAKVVASWLAFSFPHALENAAKAVELRKVTRNVMPWPDGNAVYL